MICDKQSSSVTGPSNTTLSSCSSFEDAVLMEPHKGLGDNNDLMGEYRLSAEAQ